MRVNKTIMATCPQCKGEMGATQAICPHCGYDFPLQAAPRFNSLGLANNPGNKRGVAYSQLAGCALTIGMMLTGTGAVVSLAGIVVLTLTGNYARGLIQAPLSFFMSLALFVVFCRVADMD